VCSLCSAYSSGPCAKAHPPLDEIIRNNKDVKVKLIFTATNDKNDIRGIVAKHLLAINERKNSLQTQEALDDWYITGKKDYEVFAKKYPMNGELKEQEKQIEDMKMWCGKAGITHTPTIFINGYKIPGSYSIEELKYVL
jgi:glutaredoxin